MSTDICLDFIDLQNVSIKSTAENNTYKFSFDRVFDYNSTQSQVFEYGAKQIVDSVLEGFNGTIFAYGQTSSGKTFTMKGILNDPELEGITPRLTRYLFDKISQNQNQNLEYIIKTSIFEIYNEKIKDLLENQKNNLQIREDKTKGIFIEDLSEHHVSQDQNLLNLIQRGLDNRAVNSTNMNEQSSRSHSIVVINVIQNNLKDLSAKMGKLYLVDLAGSEKISKTGAKGTVLDEAKMINKSLTTLGLVIKSLTDAKNIHIPYRDSKLTRVLQESLGGNSRTCLIITCSPSNYNESETLSTLRFGLRAKKVKNSARVNKDYSIQELKLEVNKLESQLGKFKSRCDILEEYLVKNGIPIPDENLENIQITENIEKTEILDNNPNLENKKSNPTLNSSISLSDKHLIEINQKYIEVLDIVNDLESEKTELQDQLKKASDRINAIHLNKENKESFQAELIQMKNIQENTTNEYEKEVSKMKRYMEKNNLSLISEENVDFENDSYNRSILGRSIIGRSFLGTRINRKSCNEFFNEKKDYLNEKIECKETDENIIKLEVENEVDIIEEIKNNILDENLILNEISSDKITKLNKETEKENSRINDKDENIYLITTNPFSNHNNLDVNTNSADYNNFTSKYNNNNNTLDNLTNSGSNSTNIKNNEVIDELLDQLKAYGDKVPEINKIIENFKEKIHPKTENLYSGLNPLSNNIFTQSRMRKLQNNNNTMSSGKSSSSYNSIQLDEENRKKKVSEAEKNKVLSVLESKVEKLFDNHLKEKNVLKSTVKNENFANWNLKCWKEKFKNLNSITKK